MITIYDVGTLAANRTSQFEYYTRSLQSGGNIEEIFQSCLKYIEKDSIAFKLFPGRNGAAVMYSDMSILMWFSAMSETPSQNDRLQALDHARGILNSMAGRMKLNRLCLSQ